MRDEFEIMIAAQMNDPAPIAPAMPDQAPVQIGTIRDLRSDPPAFAPAESTAPGKPGPTLHPGFGPLALPALVAATRVMRGATNKVG